MTGTELVQRTPMQDVLAAVRGEDFLGQVRAALPGGVLAERFVRVTITAIQQNPELITVDRNSLFRSVIRCAQDGLLPDGREAALVIFESRKDGKQAQYLPMIGGYRKVAAKHGITLNSFVVYDNDEFEYTLGENPHIHHKPPRLGQDRGDPIGAYACATYADGRMVCPPEVMDNAAIDQVRQVSRAKDSEYGPWVKWWDRMARKTVARLLFKQLPLGDLDELDTRVLQAADDEADLDKPAVLTEEEANISVAASAQVGGTPPPDDGHPDDAPAEDPPANDTGQTSFADRAEEAKQRRAAGAAS